MRRDENQDSFGVIRGDDFRAYFVADGMGGAQGGATASRMAIAVLQEALTTPGFRAAPAEVEGVVHSINRRIFEKGVNDPAFAGMGTTLVGLVFTPSGVMGVNVGDSRAYRVRAGAISQISEDHTLVRELVRSGAISEQEAEQHPVSHMLTRSLGPVATVQVECAVLPQVPEFGDIYILCSDGLYNCVSEQELLAVVTQNPLDDANQILINLANQRGGVDNITVLFMDLPVADIDPSIRKEATDSQAESEERGDERVVVPPPVQEPRERRTTKRGSSGSDDGIRSYSTRFPLTMLVGVALVVGLVLGNVARRILPGELSRLLSSDTSAPPSGASVSQNERGDDSSGLMGPVRTREELLRTIRELNEKLEDLTSDKDIQARSNPGSASAKQEIEERRTELELASREEALWRSRVYILRHGAPEQVKLEQRKVAAYSVAVQNQWDTMTEAHARLTRLQDQLSVEPENATLAGEIKRLEKELADIERNFSQQVIAFARSRQEESATRVAMLTQQLNNLEKGGVAPTDGAPSKSTDSSGPFPAGPTKQKRPLEEILKEGFGAQ
jgi:protein phosphatase